MDQNPTPEPGPDTTQAAYQPPSYQQPYGQPYQHVPGPPPPYQAPRPASGVDPFFDGIRRTGLVRSHERWMGGVAGGIALRLGLDPLVVRGLLGASVLLGGFGLVIYGLGWLLLPEQADGRIHLQQLIRGDFDAAVMGGLAIFVAGLWFPARWFPAGLWGGYDDGWFGGLLWASAVVVVIAVIVAARGANRSPGTNPPVAGGAPGPWPAPPAHPVSAQHPAGTPFPGRPEGPLTAMTPTQQGAVPEPGATATYPAAPAAGRPQTGAYAGPHTGPYAGPYPASGYPGAPGRPPAYGPYPARPGTPLPQPPRPVTPRGPGAGAVGIVLALSLITLATLMALSRVGQFDGPVLLTAGAITVVLLGAGVVLAGVRGRTSGGLGGLAVLTTFLVLPGLAVHGSGWDGAWEGGFGELDVVPTTTARAAQGYELTAGDARVDLTELPEGAGPVLVPISVGAGDLTVVLPAGAAYTAEISVTAGEVSWLGATTSGMPANQGNEAYTSPAAADGQTPEFELDINVGFGAVTVIEEGR